MVNFQPSKIAPCIPEAIPRFKRIGWDFSDPQSVTFYWICRLPA